jgi:hypothetical protein
MTTASGPGLPPAQNVYLSLILMGFFSLNSLLHFSKLFNLMEENHGMK